MHSLHPFTALLAKLHIVAHARHLLVFLCCLDWAIQSDVKLALCVQLDGNLARRGLIATFLCVAASLIKLTEYCVLGIVLGATAQDHAWLLNWLNRAYRRHICALSSSNALLPWRF